MIEWRDDFGAAWLRGWTAAWFVVIALFATCCSRPRPVAPPAPPRVVTVTLKCLTMPPPKHPELAGDPAIDKARLEQAYDELRLWVELYAWPICAE